jgi:hypothetical protein
MDDNNLLKNQLISLNLVWSNDISVNLIIDVNFIGIICPKSCVIL